jgi:hypothetical protein
VSQTNIAKALNTLMMTHSLYIEHIPCQKMLEMFMLAINEEEDIPITIAQMHDLWEDKSVGVGRAKRETGTAKDGKAMANSRKRGASYNTSLFIRVSDHVLKVIWDSKGCVERC